MQKARLLTATSVLTCLVLWGCAATPVEPRKPKTSQVDAAYLAAHACGTPTAANRTAEKFMPFLTGLAPIHYAVSSSNPEVQRYFDQGLALLYGFEYATAYRSFKAAHDLEPDCAMCAWGMAMALGPNINNGDMSEKSLVEARDLVSTALKNPNLGDKDRGLLESLSIRYAPNPPANQANVFAEKYADTLIAASERWPDDDFIAVLAAEAAMTARPWDYWEAGGHVPLPWAAKAIKIVEMVLKRNPDQPEAIHLYIHLTEASDNPHRAEPFADKLGVLAPNSPHLVHMPSHTYYPVGRFADAIRVNVKAIAIDEDMARALGEDPVGYGYFSHHATFILSAAQQVGDGAEALKIAGDLEKGIPLSKAVTQPWSEGGLALAMEGRAQFSTPQSVLALTTPDKRLKMVTIVWRAARAEAFAKLGKFGLARSEIKALQKVGTGLKVQGEPAMVLQRAEEMATGRVELAAGNLGLAADHFRAAAQIDGKFSYSEPPLWDRPGDIALGRVLLMTGDSIGAKSAFERVLKTRPGNAYATWGLAQAEVKLGDNTGSQAAMAEFDRIWLGDKGAMSLDLL